MMLRWVALCVRDAAAVERPMVLVVPVSIDTRHARYFFMVSSARSSFSVR